MRAFRPAYALWSAFPSTSTGSKQLQFVELFSHEETTSILSSFSGAQVNKITRSIDVPPSPSDRGIDFRARKPRWHVLLYPRFHLSRRLYDPDLG